MGSLPRRGGGGGCLEEVAAKMGACRANNGNMGTKGIRMKATEKVVCYWHDGWMKDTHKGKKTTCLVWTVLRSFIHTDVKLGKRERKRHDLYITPKIHFCFFQETHFKDRETYKVVVTSFIVK